MFRRSRSSIAGWMGIVVVVALGLTALSRATYDWAGAVWASTYALLCLAVVGASSREGKERAAWVGFAVFGWGFLFLAFDIEHLLPPFPFDFELMQRVREIFGPMPHRGYHEGDHQSEIFRCLAAIVAAVCGGVASRIVFGEAGGLTERRDVVNGPAARTGEWLRGPMFAGTAGLVAAILGLVGFVTKSENWAAASFYATWAFLGTCTVGGLFGTRRHRPGWIGALLFGSGFLYVTTSPKAGVPTWTGVVDKLLIGARSALPWSVRVIPATSDGIAESNRMVRKALDVAVPMPFRAEVPLLDVLNHVIEATKGPDGKRVAFYVDPIGLKEAEKTLDSPVSIDLTGVPLKTTLRLVLRQLGMCYRVEGGLMYITAESSSDSDWDWDALDDPLLISGRCVLAVIAAGAGWVSGKVVGGEQVD